MSRTDKTTPWRVIAERGDCNHHGYPCAHLSLSRRVQVCRFKHTRRSRTQLRADLAAGREPSTAQHRHSALWDAW